MRSLRVLIACEFSGIVRDAFAKRGHDAWSCDILPSESPGNHIQGDVLEILGKGWDLMIGHPPCTFLSFVGNRHWNAPGREEKRQEAMTFFMRLMDAPIEKICLENPRGYPMQVFRRPDQIIHPYFFGDPAKKTTCLWLKGLPKLIWIPRDDLFSPPTAVEEPKPVYRLRTTGKAIHWTEANHGGKVRSKFWPGVAKAMAEQWG